MRRDSWRECPDNRRTLCRDSVDISSRNASDGFTEVFSSASIDFRALKIRITQSTKAVRPEVMTVNEEDEAEANQVTVPR